MSIKVYEENFRRISQEWNENSNMNVIVEFSSLFEELRVKNEELGGKNEEY